MTNRKQINEHLSNIYFSNNKKPRKGPKEPKSFFRLCVLIASFIFFVTGSLFFVNSRILYKNKSRTDKYIVYGIIKLNYNFTKGSPKKEKISMDLANLDVRGFKNFEFSIRKLSESYQQNLSIELAIENYFNEKSDYFITLNTNNWQRFKIGLSDLRGITDWSNLKSLSFKLDEYNAQSRSGTVLIDEICFSK